MCTRTPAAAQEAAGQGPARGPPALVLGQLPGLMVGKGDALPTVIGEVKFSGSPCGPGSMGLRSIPAGPPGTRRLLGLKQGETPRLRGQGSGTWLGPLSEETLGG